MKEPLLTRLSFQGLHQAPPQQLGAIRLVPLLRTRVLGDLRLGRRHYDALAVVSVDSQIDEPGRKYVSYVPHALVMSWTQDGSPVTACGTQLEENDAGPSPPSGARRPVKPVQLLHRMVQREADRRLRFLPLYLAMEGFLSMFFGGPDIAWSEYSKQALRHGLSPRWETSAPGRAVPLLEDALRVFEIHEGQCGVLLYVADALASAFVVPHPADYRLLHRTLIEDFYGELVYQYARLYKTVVPLTSEHTGARPQSLAELRAVFEQAQQQWRGLSELLAGRLLGCEVQSTRVYRAGDFLLQRFITRLRLEDDNHIGEAITRADGELEYLKTYRLSAAQARRAYLLQVLAAHKWSLDAAARSVNQNVQQFSSRLVSAGFGYLLSEPVLRLARKAR